FAETADFRKRRDIRVHDCGFEIVDAHPAQHRERQLRPDAAHIINEQSKKIALSCGHESVKDVCIFPHMKMGEDADVLPGRRKFVVTRKRNKNSIARSRFISARKPRTRLRKYQTRLGSSNSTEPNCMSGCKYLRDSWKS